MPRKFFSQRKLTTETHKANPLASRNKFINEVEDTRDQGRGHRAAGVRRWDTCINNAGRETPV
jgi:hypothetical protein